MSISFIKLEDGREATLLSPVDRWTMIKIKGHNDYFIVYHLKEIKGVWNWESDMGYGKYSKDMKEFFKKMDLNK